MLGRFTRLIPPALLVAPLAALLIAGAAQAHRLLGEYRILPDKQVRIESWFDLTGDSPVGARVQVFRPDGSLLAEGKLDDKGVFVFTYSAIEALKVVISAGAGHRAELSIAARELAGESREADPGADRSARVSFKDVLTGIGFVLALAAFALGLRNARLLHELKTKDERKRE